MLFSWLCHLIAWCLTRVLLYSFKQQNMIVINTQEVVKCNDQWVPEFGMEKRQIGIAKDDAKWQFIPTSAETYTVLVIFNKYIYRE